MKRRSFIKGAGLGAAALAVPIASATASNYTVTMGDYVHDPADWALVPEEPEEFQEYEVDIPEDWAEEDIILI